MTTPSLLDLTAHDDRCLRRIATNRPGVVRVDLPVGWVRMQPGVPPGDFASICVNRVMWRHVEQPIDRATIDAAVSLLREHRIEKAAVWLSPKGWSTEVETALKQSGAEHVPYVEYVQLVRRVETVRAEKESSLTVRMLSAAEAQTVLQKISPWFGEEWAANLATFVERADIELFAAFDDETPAAIGGLMIDRSPDGTFAHLGWASTNPAYRKRGAQSALIAARLERAVALGADWATSETNTAVATSLRNLMRLCFVPAIRWHVYEWKPR